jgi:hypothetical protein
MAEPKNKKLYNEVKSEVKQEMEWPSAYASAALSKKYKKRGGTYEGAKGPKLSEALKKLSKSE